MMVTNPHETIYPQEYLGDGCYASFDGYHVWLAVNDHKNLVVALEPEVLAALDRYAARIADIVTAMHRSTSSSEPVQ
jgi:hypothetical protein